MDPRHAEEVGSMAIGWEQIARELIRIAKRLRREAGEVLTDIARSYNVSHSTIGRLS